jgi:hypothetical protein
VASLAANKKEGARGGMGSPTLEDLERNASHV